ncbi:MAG: tetratricopeptide repeat protein, partial [Catalinimonas sp.]
MSEETQTYEELDAYLRDELDTPARAALEDRLAADGALREELAWRRDVMRGVQAAEREDLRAYLRDLEARAAGPQTFPMRTDRRWPLPAAAALVLLLVAAYLLWPGMAPTDELVAAHFEPYPNVVVVVERGNAAPKTTLATVMRQYESGQYATAAALLEEMLTTAPGNDTLYFYLGNSYLATGRYAEASG